MNFDIKDVKSWYNRHDVKVGDKGYFFNIIQKTLDNSFKRGIITKINNDRADCFVGAFDYPVWDYNFFLPVDVVENEKKYRPFKDLYEFYNFLSISPFTKKDFHNEYLLRFSFTYREKAVLQIATMAVITRIDFGLDNDPHSTFVNRRGLKDWFDNYELMNNKGEWVPFGVEIEDE